MDEIEEKMHDSQFLINGEGVVDEHRWNGRADERAKEMTESTMACRWKRTFVLPAHLMIKMLRLNSALYSEDLIRSIPAIWLDSPKVGYYIINTGERY